MMFQKRFFLFAAGVIILSIGGASCVHPNDDSVAANPKDTLLLYIMAGQSNMAGRGIIEPQDTVTNPRILSLDSTDHLVLAREPLHIYQPGISGLDCGLSFGNAMLPFLKSNVKIGLIPCAVGSTSVADWLGDSVRVVALYSNLLRRARAGMEHGVIAGVLWHQGENESSDDEYKTYAVHLQALILKLRKDLGNDHLPFLAGHLAAFLQRPYRDTVNASIDHTAQALPYVYVIETSDLTCNPDQLHFDAKAQRLLGYRFAQVAGPIVGK